MAKHKRGGTRRTSQGPMVLLVVAAVGLVGLFSYAVYRDRSKPPAPSYTDAAPKPQPETGCASSPVKVQIEGVERVPCRSQAHVATGERVLYDTDPPLSGAHYGGSLNAGFYTAQQTPERVVHSLEHGHVVIYYNKAKLSAKELDAVRDLTRKYRGAWDGVLAIPRDEPQYALILTAWEHALRLPAFDEDRIDRFVDAFRGRGPENAVR